MPSAVSCSTYGVCDLHSHRWAHDMRCLQLCVESEVPHFVLATQRRIIPHVWRTLKISHNFISGVQMGWRLQRWATSR